MKKEIYVLALAGSQRQEGNTWYLCKEFLETFSALWTERGISVVFASPVYVAAVSGDMKRLIDRLSCWLHTIPLIGKAAAVLSTADSNSGDKAISYMGWALEIWEDQGYHKYSSVSEIINERENK